MKTRDGLDPLSIVSKIADQEKELIGSTFIAPYVGGGKVRLRLSGIIYEMEVADCPEGWSIFKVRGAGKSVHLQRAALTMVRNYLELFPQIRLVLIDQLIDNRWWALPATTGRSKIQLDGPIPVQLTERVSPFETVYCRFDGSNFWYESTDRKRDPLIARQLRKALSDDEKPEDLQCKGMAPQERLAYKMLYLNKHAKDKAAAPPDDKSRIAQALEHSGARLDAFWYQRGNNNPSVRFEAGGRTHVVQVDASDLTVVSAGICLSGQESNFDLGSLVGVLRQAEHDYYYDD